MTQAGAGKTTTVAAKEKYLVEKQGVDLMLHMKAMISMVFLIISRKFTVVKAIIEWMISEHLILKTKGRYPVLHSTYEGLHYSEIITESKSGRGDHMESIDVKKLETAITYIQRIADGKNPVNNMPAEEDAVLNNPNVIRCMFFIKEVLEEVKRNNGRIGRRTPKSDKAEFPLEILESFSYREDKAISKFVGQMNELVDENVYQKLSYRPISQWLKLNGFLAEEFSQEFGKKITLPTEKGIRLGIRTERSTNAKGVEYMLLLYGKQAQEYIVQNMKDILSGEVT